MTGEIVGLLGQYLGCNKPTTENVGPPQIPFLSGYLVHKFPKWVIREDKAGSGRLIKRHFRIFIRVLVMTREVLITVSKF